MPVVLRQWTHMGQIFQISKFFDTFSFVIIPRMSAKLDENLSNPNTL